MKNARRPALIGTVAIAAVVVGLPYARARADHMLRMPHGAEVLPGRATRMPLPPHHLVYGTPLDAPFAGMQRAYFGMGCFWGAEEHFFHLPGVVSTAVGYAAGVTPNPTYEEVTTGRTGHAEIVMVVFDPRRVTYADLLRVFWEGHDPTQGMRQGNDVGTNYRSVILTTDEQQARAARASRDAYSAVLESQGHHAITTEIAPLTAFYVAEGYHQQYCHVNPEGYCGHGGTGVPYPR
jgi:peptide-methionine (S)-S-oxide reductase